MFERITTNPEVLGGKPCVKGTRLSVEFLLELAASGASRDQIVRRFPQLTPDDVEQAFRFAGAAIRTDAIVSVEVAR